jgi:hypothetical protein
VSHLINDNIDALYVHVNIEDDEQTSQCIEIKRIEFMYSTYHKTNTNFYFNHGKYLLYFVVCFSIFFGNKFDVIV